MVEGWRRGKEVDAGGETGYEKRQEDGHNVGEWRRDRRMRRQQAEGIT